MVKSTRSKLPARGWKREKRVSAFQAPPKSRFRRGLGWVFNVWTGTVALIVLLAAVLTGAYFWFEYSDRIDRRLLSGEIFTPTAGIYSAPKTLKKGDHIMLQELIDYLKSAVAL